MDRETLWKVFENTGSVEAYLQYKKLSQTADVKNGKEQENANLYRWAGTEGQGH